MLAEHTAYYCRHPTLATGIGDDDELGSFGNSKRKLGRGTSIILDRLRPVLTQRLERLFLPVGLQMRLGLDFLFRLAAKHVHLFGSGRKCVPLLNGRFDKL